MRVKGYEIKSGADLQKANLQEADLRWADLRGANFRWADLRGAKLPFLINKETKFFED